MWKGQNRCRRRCEMSGLNEGGYQRWVHGAAVLAEKDQMWTRKIDDCPVLTYVGHPLVAYCSDV